jgi:hypothetical protein
MTKKMDNFKERTICADATNIPAVMVKEIRNGVFKRNWYMTSPDNNCISFDDTRIIDGERYYRQISSRNWIRAIEGDSVFSIMRMD